MKGDAEYFSRRAQQEREAAMKAANPSAREAHIALAKRYEELAGAITHDEQRLSLDQLTG